MQKAEDSQRDTGIPVKGNLARTAEALWRCRWRSAGDVRAAREPTGRRHSVDHRAQSQELPPTSPSHCQWDIPVAYWDEILESPPPSAGPVKSVRGSREAPHFRGAPWFSNLTPDAIRIDWGRAALVPPGKPSPGARKRKTTVQRRLLFPALSQVSRPWCPAIQRNPREQASRLRDRWRGFRGATRI